MAPKVYRTNGQGDVYKDGTQIHENGVEWNDGDVDSNGRLRVMQFLEPWEEGE